MATRFFIPFYTINQTFYSLKITYRKSNTSISMMVNNRVETTQDLPKTIAILEKCLPNIFTSQCFNNLNLPFINEARNTEVGHLFEHILLEYLCTIKVLYGYDAVEFSGTTRWDWNKSPRGTFAIDISANVADRIIFNESLKKAIRLMNLIFSS